MTWADVDWECNRFTVHSSKTEHHYGGESRVVPLFPELRPHLETAFDAAEPGTEHVITRYRTNANLRTQLIRIIERAGLEPWPKLFQNLRATRETELAEIFPMHVVCRWIGNSQPVAMRHYLQTTDERYERAAAEPTEALQNPAQQAHATGRSEPQALMAAHEKTPVLPGFAGGCDDVQLSPVEDRGLETGAQNTGKTAIPPKGGAVSGALYPENGPIDPDLRLIVERWDSLPASVKAGIMAMVRASWNR